MNKPFRVLKPLLFLFGFVSLTAHAESDYTFYVADMQGNALTDAVIEPDLATSISPPDDVAVIDQIDKQFKPRQILIERGQLVDFPNSDNIRHHVYSFSKAKIFELKLYADMPERPIKFSDHGVVVLGCNIHDTMIGYIFVSKSADSVMTGKEGVATLHTAAEVTHVNIWHAHNSAGPETLQRIDLAELTQDSQGRYLINMAITPPAPRNSFEDTFGGLTQDY